jgi:hypothetical protein
VAVIVTGAILRAESETESARGACAPAVSAATKKAVQRERQVLFNVCSTM